MLNNLFLVTACATVFVGTLYPLALEALTGEKISVGAPFFNATFGPLFVPLLIAVPFGPLLAWKRGDLLGVAQRLIGAAAIAAITVAVIFAMEGGGGPILVPFAIGLALFVMAGAVTEIVERTGVAQGAARDRVRRAPGACRARPGARRSRISGSASRCSASSARRSGASSGSPSSSPARRSRSAAMICISTAWPTRQGPNYRELAAQFTVRRQRRGHRRDGAGEAHLSLARHQHAPRAALMTRGFASSISRSAIRTPTARSRCGSITSRWCC